MFPRLTQRYWAAASGSTAQLQRLRWKFKLRERSESFRDVVAELGRGAEQVLAIFRGNTGCRGGLTRTRPGGEVSTISRSG